MTIAWCLVVICALLGAIFGALLSIGSTLGSINGKLGAIEELERRK